MHTDEEIKRKAFEQLEKRTAVELEDVNEIDFEVYFENPDGETERYTVFFERGFVDGKEGWVIRHIIRPDELQKPENKEDGKIE